MEQVRNVSDTYNNIFTVYDGKDIVILHVMIYYKYCSGLINVLLYEKYFSVILSYI